MIARLSLSLASGAVFPGSCEIITATGSVVHIVEGIAEGGAGVTTGTERLDGDGGSAEKGGFAGATITGEAASGPEDGGVDCEAVKRTPSGVCVQSTGVPHSRLGVPPRLMALRASATDASTGRPAARAS